MTTEPALKFGPEWLRALSQGNGTTAVNSSTSPPSSPEIPKYKLAEYRYGREEMLALFSKDIKMPRDLRQFNGLVKEICQMPMALIEFTEEEQKLWSRSVNSEAVIRLMGKGISSGIAGPPAHRGGGGRGGSSVDRGRGRGRATFYQRGLSSEDLELTTPGGLTRQRSYERTNSDRNSGWEDGFRDRKYDKPFSVRDEEAGTTIRKDGLAPLDWRSGNLRSNHIREGEDENARRIGTPRTDKWSRSNWRSDRDERLTETVTDWSSTSRTPYRKSTGGHVRLRDHDFIDGDTLPEWSIEDNKDAEKVGTFDATGAFLETKEDKDIDGIIAEKVEADSSDTSNLSSENSSSNVSHENSIEKSDTPPRNDETKPNFSNIKPTDYIEDDSEEEELGQTVTEVPVLKQLPNKIEIEPILEVPTLANIPEPIIDKKEDINFEHLEKAAESLVNTIEEDEKVDVDHASNLANVWYYRDPQGVIQGPFSDFEMAEWFRTGYFDMSLMVRQGVKGMFCSLGELSNMRNCVPFMPNQVSNGEPVPAPRTTISANQPVRGLLSGLSNHSPMPVPHQFEVVNEQEQQMRLLQQQLYHQRLMQQQYHQQRFTSRQPIQQLLGGGNPVENMAALNPSTQQQQQQFYLMQKLLAQQQPPGGLTRNPNQENSNAILDPVRQLAAQLAASQPAMQMKEDGTSLWNMATPAPSVASRIGSNLESNWRPKSVWDIDNHEKLLAATLMQTEQQLLAEEQKKKRLAEEELRTRREEEERRRRLQEEQEQRERLRLEELRRREEEERREKEELLKKQQLELEERRRKESEERRFREEEERRLKEERIKLEQLRKQEEERIKQEEFFILQQKEQQRLEELKRKEKIRQMEEEEKIKAEYQREQLEIKLRQAEALKKLQDKQKQKQGPAWGGSVLTTDNALSLAEIQRLQEEKEQQEKINREIQQQHLLQQQIQNQLLAQQQQQQARSMTNMTWAEKPNAVHGPVKSLLEIQNEEAEKLAQQKEKQAKQQLQQLQQQQTVNNLTLSSASVWNNSNSHLRQTNNSSVSYPWNTENTTHQTNGGLYFWEDQNVNTNKAKGQSTPANSKKETHTTSNGQTPKAKTTRSKKEEETVMKLFETPKLNGDEFTEWCIQALSDLQSTIDVPTFVSFLKDVDSPYEVHDYVRQYLGEGKEVHNFTKLFLENRSKYRIQARKNQSEENMWGPARAINPSLSKTQMNEIDGFKSSGGKKKKKSKMQKVDSTILGFTVHAAMDRINIGDIDHGEDM